jgi:ribosomal protein S18 acetylase RimI-like enzyme
MATSHSSGATHRARVAIRAMRPSDLDAVVQLDARVAGAPRLAYYARRLEALAPRGSASQTIGLVAEDGGALVGFIIGALTSGEFGFTDITALLDSIAVHPGRRRDSIGRQLASAFIAECAARGAQDAYTLVNWSAWDMLRFFDSIGFSLAQTVPLRRRIGAEEGGGA